MTNRSKRKGTEAERAVADFLAGFFPGVDRRAQTGALDKGDLINVPQTTVEVKACGRYDIPGWLRETEREAVTGATPFRVLVVKPRGIGIKRVQRWWAITELENYAEVLEQALR